MRLVWLGGGEKGIAKVRFMWIDEGAGKLMKQEVVGEG